MKPSVIELEDKSGWPVVVGLFGSIALVILAVAVWQVSAALSVACISIGVGLGIRESCHGIGYLIWMRRRGDAELARALTQGKAAMIAARNGAVPLLGVANFASCDEEMRSAYYCPRKAGGLANCRGCSFENGLPPDWRPCNRWRED